MRHADQTHLGTDIESGEKDSGGQHPACEETSVQKALGYIFEALKLLDKTDEKIAVVQIQFAIDILRKNGPAQTVAEADAVLGEPENIELLRQIGLDEH